MYLLFIRALPVLQPEEDQKRKWPDYPEAREIFLQAREKAAGHPVFPCYAVSDSVANTIVDITATMGLPPHYRGVGTEGAGAIAGAAASSGNLEQPARGYSPAGLRLSRVAGAVPDRLFGRASLPAQRLIHDGQVTVGDEIVQPFEACALVPTRSARPRNRTFR